MPKNDIRVGLVARSSASSTTSTSSPSSSISKLSTDEMRLAIDGQELIIQRQVLVDVDDEDQLDSCANGSVSHRHPNGNNSNEVKDEVNGVNRRGAHQRDKSIRTVTLSRSDRLGLGLSIKGGADHQFPVVISRIAKDGPADRSRRLFVGDQIIEIDGNKITGETTHDQALKQLKSGRPEVTLKVKHHRAADVLRKTWRRDEEDPKMSLEMDNPLIADKSVVGKSSTPSSVVKRQVLQWTDCVRMDLFLAHQSRYLCDCDRLRDAGFEIRSATGQTAVVQCDDDQTCLDWCATITKTVESLTTKHMKHLNSFLPPSEHVLHLGWVAEGSPIVIKTQPTRSSYKWSLRYLMVVGGHAFLFAQPPVAIVERHEKLSTNFLSSESMVQYKLFQAVFRCVRERETVDGRQNCFVIQSTGEPAIRYFSVETPDELQRIKNAWHRANYNSVTKLGSKTFHVSEDGCRPGSLILDWRMGFAFYDIETKTYRWKYQFHQLKHSSDDSRLRILLLTFVTDPADSRVTETRRLACQAGGNLQNLLYCMHAFLSAKVASVDPRFLQAT